MIHGGFQGPRTSRRWTTQHTSRCWVRIGIPSTMREGCLGGWRDLGDFPWLSNGSSDGRQWILDWGFFDFFEWVSNGWFVDFHFDGLLWWLAILDWRFFFVGELLACFFVCWDVWKNSLEDVGNTSQLQVIPSGYVKIAIEICPIIVDLPIKDGYFP